MDENDDITEMITILMARYPSISQSAWYTMPINTLRDIFATTRDFDHECKAEYWRATQEEEYIINCIKSEVYKPVDCGIHCWIDGVEIGNVTDVKCSLVEDDVFKVLPFVKMRNSKII